jgi:hypothetical protein
MMSGFMWPRMSGFCDHGNEQLGFKKYDVSWLTEQQSASTGGLCFIDLSFRYVTPCSVVDVDRRFGGTYCLHLQGRKVSQATTNIQKDQCS